MPKGLKGRKKTRTLSFKTTREMEERLELGARLIGLSKSMLALTAIEAVLAAIERDRKLVFPIDVASVAAPNPRIGFGPEPEITAERVLAATRTHASQAAATDRDDRALSAKRDASHDAAGSMPSATS
jgi:hypothetical protein